MVILKSGIANENEKQMATKCISKVEHSDSFRIMDESTFGLVAEPEHLEILVAMELDGFDGTIDWPEQNLPIPLQQLKICLERLLLAGLICQRAELFYPNHEYLATSHDVPSRALRLSHKLTLKKAIESLDEVAVELRDITSMTMAIDIDKLTEAKSMIKNFQKKPFFTPE